MPFPRRSSPSKRKRKPTPEEIEIEQILLAAEEAGIEFDWEYDTDADWSWMDEKQRKEDHEVFYCLARAEDGRVASLGGIFDPDTQYKRQVESDLARELGIQPEPRVPEMEDIPGIERYDESVMELSKDELDISELDVEDLKRVCVYWDNAGADYKATYFTQYLGVEKDWHFTAWGKSFRGKRYKIIGCHITITIQCGGKNEWRVSLSTQSTVVKVWNNKIPKSLAGFDWEKEVGDWVKPFAKYLSATYAEFIRLLNDEVPQMEDMPDIDRYDEGIVTKFKSGNINLSDISFNDYKDLKNTWRKRPPIITQTETMHYMSGWSENHIAVGKSYEFHNDYGLKSTLVSIMVSFYNDGDKPPVLQLSLNGRKLMEWAANQVPATLIGSWDDKDLSFRPYIEKTYAEAIEFLKGDVPEVSDIPEIEKYDESLLAEDPLEEHTYNFPQLEDIVDNKLKPEFGEDRFRLHHKFEEITLIIYSNDNLSLISTNFYLERPAKDKWKPYTFSFCRKQGVVGNAVKYNFTRVLPNEEIPEDLVQFVSSYREDIYQKTDGPKQKSQALQDLKKRTPELLPIYNRLVQLLNPVPEMSDMPDIDRYDEAAKKNNLPYPFSPSTRIYLDFERPVNYTLEADKPPLLPFDQAIGQLRINKFKVQFKQRSITAETPTLENVKVTMGFEFQWAKRKHSAVYASSSLRGLVNADWQLLTFWQKREANRPEGHNFIYFYEESGTQYSRYIKWKEIDKPTRLAVVQMIDECLRQYYPAIINELKEASPQVAQLLTVPEVEDMPDIERYDEELVRRVHRSLIEDNPDNFS